MSMPTWICLLLVEAMMVASAPKLGHVLFDPLSYEAAKFEQINTYEAAKFEQINTPLSDVITTSTTQEETTIAPATQTVPTTTTSEITDKILHKLINKSARKNECVEEPRTSDILKLTEAEGLKKQTVPSKSLRTNDTGSYTKMPCAEYEYNGKICKYINNRLLCGYNKNKGKLKNDEFIDMGNGCRMRQGRIECGYEIGPFNKPRRPPARDEIPIYDETQNLVKKPVRNLRSNQSINSEEILANVSTSTSIEPNTASPAKTETSSATPKLVITIPVTTASTPEMETAKTQITTGPTTELVTTTLTTTVSSTELVQSASSIDMSNYSIPNVTSTIQAISDSTAPATAPEIPIVENSSASAKVARSIDETSNEQSATTPGATVKRKPNRWCVEKGDRIVCHYGKNY